MYTVIVVTNSRDVHEGEENFWLVCFERTGCSMAITP